MGIKRRYLGKALGYGAVFGAGSFALQWADDRWLDPGHPRQVYVSLIALVFLAIGVAVGIGLFRPASPPVEGNPAAVAALGISPRELIVLQEIAAGHSTKEIARRLHVSPHTVKTHVARLFEKLGARRRTDAVNRARQLGLVR